MTDGQSRMALYLMGDKMLNHVWEAPSIWGGAVAYITSWSNDTTYRGGCFNNTNFRGCLIFFLDCTRAWPTPMEMGDRCDIINKRHISGNSSC